MKFTETVLINCKKIGKLYFRFTKMDFFVATELVGYHEKFNPLTESFGFSEGQFQTSYSNVTTKNSSSIFIPLNITSNVNGLNLYSFLHVFIRI